MLLLVALFIVSPCVGVWVLPKDGKVSDNDVIKSNANYSIVQCIASCRRSTQCQTVSFTKNGTETIGECLHMKQSNGTCGNKTSANSTVSVESAKNEKVVESAEVCPTYRVKSGISFNTLSIF